MGFLDQLFRKDQTVASEHEGDLDYAAAPVNDVAPGATYLGGGAKVSSGTGDVTGFDDPNKQSYAHGAFMGAGGAFMKDPLWNQIFRAVWPEEFERIAKIEEIRDVMLALENNPVLAAYGECHALESRGQEKGKADANLGGVVPQEWDVWLDKEDPGNLSKVKIAHGGFATTILQNLNRGQQDKVIGYNRDDVKASKNGAEWMQIFGKAIAMFRGGSEVKDEGADKATERHAAMQRALDTTTADAAVATCVEFMKKENGGGLILDVKSTYSSAADINTFIATLQGKGVDVFGVGTFRHDQLGGLQEGIRPVKFFHGIQGVQNAADNNEIKQGDHLMFNAGSLVDTSGGWIRQVSYGIDQSAFQMLVALQKTYDLNIGLYVQEGDVDEKAVAVIVQMVNAFPWLFRDGFAYGNLNGKAELETEGDGLGSQNNADSLDEAKQKRW